MFFYTDALEFGGELSIRKEMEIPLPGVFGCRGQILDLSAREENNLGPVMDRVVLNPRS